MNDDILCAFVEICNRVVSSIALTRESQNWFILRQFYRLWYRLNNNESLLKFSTLITRPLGPKLHNTQTKKV